MRLPKPTRIRAALVTGCAGLVVALSASAADAAVGPFGRPDSGALEAQVIPVRVTAPGEAHTPSPPPGLDAPAGRYIDATAWLPDPNGRRLAVYPTDYARHDAPTAEWDAAWTEVVEREPDADHPHMRDQFRCHVDFARIADPDKPSWNLELWRPDVGYFATVFASCNPS